MKVEIWSDFVCPFCYIGKRKFEQALARFSHQEQVEVTYKSYELSKEADKNPNKDIHELLADKYGMTIERSRKMHADMEKQAKAVGLKYNFDIVQPTNTFDAHRTAKYAETFGKGTEVTEILLQAYFTDGKQISDHHILSELVTEAGLVAEATIEMLATDAYVKEVREDEEEAKKNGVEGVPFFVFNNKYAVSGAQSPDAFLEVLEKVWQEEKHLSGIKIIANEEASYCTGDNCTGE